jgi:hypothetical protein
MTRINQYKSVTNCYIVKRLFYLLSLSSSHGTASTVLCGMDSFGSGWGLVAGCCEYGNEHFGYIKGREFHD